MLTVVSREDGGFFQWQSNVLGALNALASGQVWSQGLDGHSDAAQVCVHVFHYDGYEGAAELQSEFPLLQYHRINRLGTLVGKVLRRLAVYAPALVPWLRLGFPLNIWLRRSRIDLALFPTVVLDSALCTTPHVFFVADLAHVLHPEFPEVSADRLRRQRRVEYGVGLPHATHVVVESTQLKNDAVAIYGLHPAKISVLYQAVPRTLERQGETATDPEAAAFRATLPEKYLFYPAQLWQHKNHLRLLDGLQLLRAGGVDISLVLVGSRKPGSGAIFERVDALGLTPFVRYLGYVEDRFMPVLYRNAQALVLPTYFGPTNIPTLEAFFYGCPAVISDVPGVEEQVGDAALRFDPNSARDMADKILAVLRDEDMRRTLVARGYERLKLLSRDRYDASFTEIIGGVLAKLGTGTGGSASSDGT